MTDKLDIQRAKNNSYTSILVYITIPSVKCLKDARLHEVKIPKTTKIVGKI